jgi:anti-anti-sigma factor
MVTLFDDLKLTGEELEHADAEAIRQKGNALIARADGEVTFDLGGLQRANSLTVAVLVDWYRTATLQQKGIVFANLSKEMRNIIEFSGLSDLLLGKADTASPA